MKFDKLIQSLIRNRKITLFFVFLVIAAGTAAYIAMPKQETPDFSTPYAMITTVFPGASQNDVDAYVTVPIDTALQAVEGYETSFSYSANNLSLVVLKLKFSADKEAAFRQVKEILAGLQSSLPQACGEISVNTSITDTAGVLISLSSADLTNRQVAEQARAVQDKLSTIQGFSRFEIIGSLEQNIVVTMNGARMQASGMTFADTVSLIGAGNIDLPMGNITTDHGRMSVDYAGGYQSLEDVAALPIGYSAQMGRTLRLRDIADVSYQTADRSTYYTHNGEQAVILAGYFEPDINVLPLKQEIEDALQSLTGSLPEGLDVSLIISQPQEIGDSLTSFLNNLLISVGLVILVVLFGMGFKNAVVVSVSLPLSVLMSFLAMDCFGIKIHQISVSALVQSLGMLVDNSIVVSDAIQNYLDEGEKRMDACVRGIRSVALPILTSTLTTVAAFAPFIFLNSMAGDYIRSLPQIVCIALAASYLSAVFIIPVLGSIFFRPRPKKNVKKKQTFKRLLEASLRHRALVIGVVLALLAGSAYLGANLNQIFFPASDKNILYIDVRSKVSGDLDATRAIVGELSQALAVEPGVTDYSASVGGALPRFNDILYIYTQTPDVGQIMMRVDLKKAGFETNAEYQQYLQRKIDALALDAKVDVKELMYGFPMDEDVKIRIVGNDLSQLMEDGDAVYGILTDVDGLIDVNRENIRIIDTYDMTIDAAKALAGGLVPAQAQNEISIAMLGREAAYRMDGEYREPIIVTGGAQTIEGVQAVALKKADGGYVNAGDILSLTETQAVSTIPRMDGSYVFTVTANYDPNGNGKEALAEAKAQIAALDLGGVDIVYDGEQNLIQENFGQVGAFGLVALAVVFVILLLQFKSFRMPLIIFITIPLSVIGSAAGLYVTGMPLSFTALLGVVSLLGIVVNNAIILVDTINRELANGVELRAACVNASMRRLRPILLSSITTVIGLVPLAVGQSLLFKPMAVALMSGLLVSTLLTLIVLPVFISFTGRMAKPQE